MKCAHHPAHDAIGVCTDCGVALCPECRASDERFLCGRCLVQHNQRVIRHFGLRLTGSLALFVTALSLVVNAQFGILEKLAICLMAAFFPFGWSALSKVFSPGDQYPFGLMRWVALASHAGASAALGWIVGPFQLYKGVREILKARRANVSVQQP